MKHEKRRRTESGVGRDPSENDPGILGKTPTTEEEIYAREAGLVDEFAQIGFTVTGDEREITRTGDGGLEAATGRDTTLGHDPEAPLTGGATPAEALAHGRRTVREDAGENPERRTA
ncbi:MAG TPA: hypothetical protein VFF73_37640 [Planctomycetota bacterium]|nr:hypothetical protein [Planctomycetota bacterium]